MAALAAACAAATLAKGTLAWQTHARMGWRQHSRCRADPRAPHAALRAGLWRRQHAFATTLQVASCLALVAAASCAALALASPFSLRRSGHNVSVQARTGAPPAAAALLAMGALVAIPLAWLAAARQAVLRASAVLQAAVTLTGPLLLAWPVSSLQWALTAASGAAAQRGLCRR